jgi:predicted flap endonuclease-1-like 5' DNA nuclease
MSYRIDEIEGIGPAYRAKLGGAGVDNTDDLLEKAASKKGRSALAEATGIDEARILSWVNLADLMRVKGIGRQFAELLHAAGVDTIKELRNRNAANLAKAVAEANAEKNLAKTVPSEGQVAGFIEAAKTMEPMVTH